MYGSYAAEFLTRQLSTPGKGGWHLSRKGGSHVFENRGTVMTMKNRNRVLAIDDEPSMIEWLKILLEH